MRSLFNKTFVAVGLGHFMVDIFNGQRSLIFAFLSVPLALSNTVLGFYNTAYVLLGSLMQPIFGYLTDRVGPRWVLAGGVFWLAGFFTAGILTPGIAGMWLLVLGSLGSGAFHPAGAMLATLAGRDHLSSRETTASSIFFVFGQSGLFLGPLLAGQILDNIGLKGIVIFTFAALPIGFYALLTLKGVKPVDHKEKAKEGNRKTLAKPAGRVLLAFAVMVAFQSWAQQNMMTYLPKYMLDLGQSPTSSGIITSLFMAGSAVGLLAGGNLADKYGKRKIASIGLSMAVVPFFIISWIGWSPWLYLLIPLSGAFTGVTHTIAVVLAQKYIPSGMALASGLILGYIFSSGALGALLSGYLADLWGFSAVFQITGGIVLIAAILARNLPKS